MSVHVYLHVMRMGRLTDSRMTITALGPLSSHVTISASLIWGREGFSRVQTLHGRIIWENGISARNTNITIAMVNHRHLIFEFNKEEKNGDTN